MLASKNAKIMLLLYNVRTSMLAKEVNQMKIAPAFTGSPLSSIECLTTSESKIPLWIWSSWNNGDVEEPDDINQLITQGYQRVPAKDSYNPGIQAPELLPLTTQLCRFLFVKRKDAACDIGAPETWAHVSDVEHVKKYPVTLAFSTTLKEPGDSPVSMLHFLPPPTLGEYAQIEGSRGTKVYSIGQLASASIERWKQMVTALNKLSYPSEWYTFSDLHRLCADEERYQRLSLLVEQGTTLVDGRPITKDRSKFLQEAHQQVADLRQGLNQLDWTEQWQAIVTLARELSIDYYTFHQEVEKKERVIHLPAPTSNQRTPVPSGNGMRGLAQGFGHVIEPGLWNEENSEELIIKTPNNSLLRTVGANEHERIALYTYIHEELGVEGLKHMVGFLHAYYQHTGARERKEDAVVTPYGLLKMLGYPDKEAGRIEVQRKIMNTLLYLSRTWVVTNETEYEAEKRGPGRKRRKGVEYTPLIVLEALKASEQGGIQIPAVIEFHLGKEFYDSLFGSRKRFFTLPTAQMLSYHSEREQQEICLAFHLTSFITLNGGSYTVHFPTLVESCALRSKEDMQHGNDRLRDATRIIYGLEHLERDEWYIRKPHENVDTALAAEYYLWYRPEQDSTRLDYLSYLEQCEQTKQLAVAPETYKRITTTYSYLQGKPEDELRKIRRQAIQQLLSINNSLTQPQSQALTFVAGTLLQKQAQKVAAGRKEAQERRERAMMARALKNPAKTKAQKVVTLQATLQGVGKLEIAETGERPD
jgi:hypothetical protein